MGKWKRFDKKKPSKNGWYQCTVEVPNQQRYVMDLYWYDESQQFRDNRRCNVFFIHEIRSSRSDKRLYSDDLCDRTNDVIAWKKMPKTYMNGFSKGG